MTQSAGTSDKILKCTQSCFLLSCFLSLSFSLLDAEVGGKNVDACGSFSPPVGLNVQEGQSVRRLEKAGSFFFFISKVFLSTAVLMILSLLSVTGAGCMWRDGGVYLCEVGGDRREFSIFLDLELILQIPLCWAAESGPLTMSTHHYRKQFRTKLGQIVHTCARNFGPRSQLNTSYLKELVFSGWFCVCRCFCLCVLEKWVCVHVCPVVIGVTLRQDQETRQRQEFLIQLTNFPSLSFTFYDFIWWLQQTSVRGNVSHLIC